MCIHTSAEASMTSGHEDAEPPILKTLSSLLSGEGSPLPLPPPQPGHLHVPLEKFTRLGNVSCYSQSNMFEYGAPRCGQGILTNMFLALGYSSGIPLLLPIGAISCVAFYLVDNFLLLKLYRRPPSYDLQLPEFIQSVLPWALGAHLVSVALYFIVLILVVLNYR